MSNVILGIIGVVFFIGLAIAGASFFGPNLTGSRVDAQAADYLNQSSQISRAIEHYASDNGKLPINGSQQPVDILVSSKYMKAAPPGGGAPWTMNTSANALLTPVVGTVAEATKVCVAARAKANMPNPSAIKRCDGSSGSLSKSDPCCLM